PHRCSCCCRRFATPDADETRRAPMRTPIARAAPSEEERESQFPFVYFLVFVPRREYVVGPILAAQEKPACEIKAQAGADVSGLLVRVRWLNERCLGLDSHHAAAQGKERRKPPLRRKYMCEAERQDLAVRCVAEELAGGELDGELRVERER